MVNWIRTGADALLTGVLMFSVLGIFFMVYVSGKETLSYEGQINSQLRDYLPTALSAANKKLGDQLRQTVRKMPLDSLIASATLDQETSATTVNNKWLFRMIICTIVLLVLVYITYVVAVKLSHASKWLPVWSHIISLLFIISLVAVVEVVFFTRIASKYIPTAPSFVVDTAINELSRDR
jgi:hypothetical protein